MYYNDAVTLTHELVGPSTYQFLPAGTRTIVGFSIQQSGTASVTLIKCGTTTIAINYGKDFPHNEVNYRCTQAISAEKTGQDSSSVIITYVPRDLNAELSNSLLITGNIDVASQSAIAVGTQGLAYIMWFGFALLILMKSVEIGLLWYRR